MTLADRLNALLDLLQPIDFPRDGTPFTLCLSYDGKGFFRVIGSSIEKTDNDEKERATASLPGDKDLVGSSPPSGGET